MPTVLCAAPGWAHALKQLTADHSKHGSLVKAARQAGLTVNPTITLHTVAFVRSAKEGWRNVSPASITQIAQRHDDDGVVIWIGHAQYAHSHKSMRYLSGDDGNYSYIHVESIAEAVAACGTVKRLYSIACCSGSPRSSDIKSPYPLAQELGVKAKQRLAGSPTMEVFGPGDPLQGGATAALSILIDLQMGKAPGMTYKYTVS